MATLEDDYPIGLDLGTTYSCIGVYRNGKVEIIPNGKGEKLTPSIVIIDINSNILVGEDTTDFLVKNYDSCIFEIKRLIGRKFSDKEVKDEIEKLPFKIIKSNVDDSPMIEIISNEIPMTYSPVEISSFIIKKMVKNAEKYLNKRISKLVITVPAYFNDSQRKLTKQAAELAGLKVLRVINEPTAAALAYGFDKNQKLNEKILVFDLGGGTFDVSIISVKIDENNLNHKVFQVLGTAGDTQLGGKDFDNKLVEYFLNKMDNKEEIKKDKKYMKKLKIKCEIIKKALSTSNETILTINNIFNNKDINFKIKREEFEDICNDLFNKLDISLDNALINAKLTRNDINEIILVGGSTRIPKIKTKLKQYFPNIKKINDEINADEAVAYGATLEAAKILNNKNGSISEFLLKDITPLSLGTNILNKSTDPKILGEGDVMSFIIERGTPLPIELSKSYSTVCDNQKEMTINIYEGENAFVKNNHLLRKSKITGLKERPKGKTEVIVTFKIDINGILTVDAKEKSENNDGQSMDTIIIKNDDILTEDKLNKLKEKNKDLLDKIKNKNEKIDYSNVKQYLQKYKEAYIKADKKYKENKNKKDKTNEEEEEEEDEDKRKTYLNNFNDTLEEFIESFDIDKNNDNDNETIIEKYYLYIKELFLSYSKILKLDLKRREKKEIIDKIKNYINKFINKNSDYLENLIKVLSQGLDDKKIFYQIVIYVMEKYNDIGKKYIESNEKYCKYNSLINYEQAEMYHEKYLLNIDKQILQKKDLENLEKQKNEYEEKIRDITNGAIVLCYESFKGGYLFGEEIISTGSGNTNKIRFFAIGETIKKGIDIKDLPKKIETYEIVLNQYEKILLEIQNSEDFKNNTKKEAICITNIIKLNDFLKQIDNKYRTLLRYAERCKLIVDDIISKIEDEENKKIFKNEKWFIEFEKLYKKLKDKEPKYEDYYKIAPKIKEKNPKIFNEIEEKFNKKEKPKDFIDFILEEHPYENYEEDKKNNTIFNKYSRELVNFLLDKYHPDNYSFTGDVENGLNYCINHEIYSRLNLLYITP